MPTGLEKKVAELTMSDSQAQKKLKVSSDLEDFDKVFTVLVDDLTKQGLKDDEIAEASAWFKQVSEYNVPYGKKNRGLTVVHSYRYLVSDPAEEDVQIARVVGWCIEWLQAFFLVSDDVMDQSPTRRGKPCWYKCEKVGLEAINDAFFLESAVYVILKKYLKGKPYYLDIMELFHETTMCTIYGQCLDMLAAGGSKVDFSRYTMDRFKAIVKWKTAFYSFYLPVACAMHIAGFSSEEFHESAKHILLRMGEFFQTQDDFLDCYGDPSITGKIGTDIEDNKCSWLVVQALQRVTPEQRRHLEENYAQHDESKVAAVKALYNELGLKEVFKNYEEASYGQLTKLIDELDNVLPKQMFIAFAQKIYKRNK